jgi:hypothetical protein
VEKLVPILERTPLSPTARDRLKEHLGELVARLEKPVPRLWLRVERLLK